MPLSPLKEVANQIENAAIRDATYKVIGALEQGQSKEGTVLTGGAILALTALAKLFTGSKSS